LSYELGHYITFLVGSLGQKYLIGLEIAIIEQSRWEEWALTVVVIGYNLFYVLIRFFLCTVVAGLLKSNYMQRTSR